jgi:ProP effector
MDSTDKLKDVNQVIEYLAEKFPLCFSLKGEAKPLKVGLFQDLSERLNDDTQISKTQIRAAMRRYTNSWRYLKCMKVGAERVDLDGNACGVLEEQHVQHAQEKLKESQKKFQEKKKAQQAIKSEQAPTERKKTQQPKKDDKKTAFKKRKNTAKSSVKVPTSLSELKVSQRVKVKLGTSPVSGHILELSKDEINVQLDSGMTIKVSLEKIQL